MKIVLIGGGTGGHFYPLIAVAESLVAEADNQKIAELKLFYFASHPYDAKVLFDYGIEFHKVPAGKLRRYFSFQNFLDQASTLQGIFVALWKLFKIFPDVIFSKGGYESFPTLFAARILGIPVVIHESDSVPGRVNLFAKKFARRIAVSYPDAVQYFPSDKVAVTGQPIRSLVAKTTTFGSYEYLKLDPQTPTLLILGGSQGAQAINDVVMRLLDRLVQHFQIVHQVGERMEDEYRDISQTILEKNQYKNRYKLFGFLQPLALSMSAGIAKLVITRAGSMLFEISAWGIPVIVIPIPESISHDQRSNAYAYARSGAGIVIEENNMDDDVVLSEIHRILDDPELYARMSVSAKNFYQPGASQKIAQEIIKIGLTHEN